MTMIFEADDKDDVGLYQAQIRVCDDNKELRELNIDISILENSPPDFVSPI